MYKILNILKVAIYVIAILILTSCSSIKMRDSWVNKELIISHPKKVLIVGLTDNLTSKKNI